VRASYPDADNRSYVEVQLPANNHPALHVSYEVLTATEPDIVAAISAMASPPAGLQAYNTAIQQNDENARAAALKQLALAAEAIFRPTGVGMTVKPLLTPPALPFPLLGSLTVWTVLTLRARYSAEVPAPDIPPSGLARGPSSSAEMMVIEVPKIAPPAAPVLLQALYDATGAVVLRFAKPSATSAAAAAYEIYRTSDQAAGLQGDYRRFALVSTVDSGALAGWETDEVLEIDFGTLNDSSAGAGGTYYYVLVARGAGRAQGQYGTRSRPSNPVAVEA
jgi:hypothetical protein